MRFALIIISIVAYVAFIGCSPVTYEGGLESGDNMLPDNPMHSFVINRKIDVIVEADQNDNFETELENYYRNIFNNDSNDFDAILRIKLNAKGKIEGKPWYTWLFSITLALLDSSTRQSGSAQTILKAQITLPNGKVVVSHSVKMKSDAGRDTGLISSETLSHHIDRATTSAIQKFDQWLVENKLNIENSIPKGSPSIAVSEPQQSAMPPMIAILSPDKKTKSEISSVEVSFMAQDAVSLARIEVSRNGTDVKCEKLRDLQIRATGNYRESRKRGSIGNKVQLTCEVPLETGKQNITITAINTMGLKSSASVEVYYEPMKLGNIYAVIIGIGQYEDARIPYIPLSRADAEAFADYLIRDLQVPPNNVTVLLDYQATEREIRRAIGSTLRTKLSVEDTVFIFWAGHGAQDNAGDTYFVAYDTLGDPNDLFASAINMQFLTSAINRLPAERVVMILDTCHSGEAGGGMMLASARTRSFDSDAFLTKLSQSEGRVVISSSKGNQKSQERPEFGHGVFTYFLLEALKGRADSNNDHLISVSEAFDYVSRKVTSATGGLQTPIRTGNYSGTLYMGQSK
jgi:Caspase domain